MAEDKVGVRLAGSQYDRARNVAIDGMLYTFGHHYSLIRNMHSHDYSYSYIVGRHLPAPKELTHGDT